MKVLLKKLKKVSGIKKFFYFISLIFYITAFTLFIMSILKLKSIETLIRIIIITFFVIWFLIYFLSGLLTMISKKTKTFVFITLITILFCPIFIGASYYINKLYGSVTRMNSNEINYTTNLIALKETNFTSKLSIGMIEAEDDIEGNILAKTLIKKENLSNNIETYEDYHSMITDLYSGKIGACFVSSNYSIIFEDEVFEDLPEGQTGTPIADRVKVIKEYSEKRVNQDNETLVNSKTKTLTEPFTILVMGVDSTINGLTANQAFNGDTLILVTFNPNTLTTTMFSIPRDMYVPIACNHNRYAKINSSAAYGSSCVINTVKQMTGIDIDYYLKINFTGVVELVNALGGVTVDVATPDFSYDQAHKGQMCEQDSQRRFGNNLICVNPGVQTLNGEQALAYARCRHLYALSDIARNQHQQQIIEAMAQKLRTISSLSDFEKILDTVSNNMETNITFEQITSFYNVGKDMLSSSSGNALSIRKTALAYYNLPVYLPRSGMYTSALGYYQSSLDAITKLMRVNLGLEQETPVKTFSISYNEEYTTPIVGKNLAGGDRLELMEDLTGRYKEEVSNWCNNKGKTCIFETVDSPSISGLVVNQSVHIGELLNSISSITFYVSNGLGSTENPGIDDPNDSENPDENGDETNTETNPSDTPTTPGNEDDNQNEQGNQGDESSGNSGNTENQGDSGNNENTGTTTPGLENIPGTP